MSRFRKDDRVKLKQNDVSIMNRQKLLTARDVRAALLAKGYTL